MRAVSTQFRQVMARRRNFVNYATMIMADPNVGTLNLQPKDFRLGGNSIIDDIVDGDNFGVGTAIGNTVTIVLDNTDERYSLYDFYGAVFTLYVGLPLNDDGTNVEKVKIGRFTVITPATSGTLISIEAVDNMYKFDRSYDELSTSYPATLGEIVNDICLHCGVSNHTRVSGHHFDRYNWVANIRPEGDFTCRQILSYVAQIEGSYAKIDADGGLYFDWMEDINPEESLDGGNYRTVYNPDGSYYTGDKADGGTFRPWNTGYVFDGGKFVEEYTVHNLGAAKGVVVGTDDIVITGVRVTNGKDADGNEINEHVVIDEFNSNNHYAIGDIVSRWHDESYTLYKFVQEHIEGTPWSSTEVAETLDYDIAVNDNPLASGNEQDIANMLGTKLIGLRFRPFSLSHLQDPSIESGDWAFVTDIKGNTYSSFITNVTFTTIGYMSISCNAQSPSKIASTYSSQAASAIVKQNRLTAEKLDYYEMAVQRFNALVANGMGLHTYEWAKSDDGSKIYYMSDKPIIAEEDGRPRFTEHSKVWKISSAGFALCTDAGLYDTDDPRTGCQWTSGWDSEGNAVYNTLAAIGISFDWAKGGTLTLGGFNNINGKMSILDADGKERVHGDNEGIRIGRLGYTTEDGELVREKGSVIFLDTDGNMQYWFNNNYSGKIAMSAWDYGTEEKPDVKDALAIADFDAINILTDNGGKAGIALYNTNNRNYGDVWIQADAIVKKDSQFYDGYDNIGGIRLISDYIKLGRLIHRNTPDNGEQLIVDEPLYSRDNVYFDRGVYVEGTNPETGHKEYLQGDTGWIVTKNGNWTQQCYACDGIVTDFKEIDPVYDFWHMVNDTIIVIVLGTGVTEVTWDNLEQPSNGGEYSFEPHIKPPSGVSAPKITDIKQSGSSLTVYITEITMEQNGTEMKLRVIV